MALRTLKCGAILGEDKGYDVADCLRVRKVMESKSQTPTKNKSGIKGGRKNAKRYMLLAYVKRRRIGGDASTVL
jgi:hypothetical protein